MNYENLHEIINRYEQNLAFVNSAEHDEIYKWRAVKCFRDAWFSDENKDKDFATTFKAAKKESYNIIDNGQVTPTTGIVKLAEKEPTEVKRLFEEVLFSDDGGDIKLRQSHMEEFGDGIQQLIKKHFPQSWKYKQDRHAISCYLAFYSPEDNYIYRYTDAEEFAKRIEYGIDIGSGDNFKLDAYYKMCDVLVDAIKEHPTLIDEHFKYVDETCYNDESLHLLAFDIMYCARAYNLYEGFKYIPKKDAVKAYTKAQREEQERLEREEAVNQLNSQIYELELQLSNYEDISLLDVQVEHTKYGPGVIVKQDVNKITVQFENTTKIFVINRKYTGLPKFEDADEALDAFTQYDNIKDEIRRLQNELKRVLKRA